MGKYAPSIKSCERIFNVCLYHFMCMNDSEIARNLNMHVTQVRRDRLRIEALYIYRDIFGIEAPYGVKLDSKNNLPVGFVEKKLGILRKHFKIPHATDTPKTPGPLFTCTNTKGCKYKIAGF